LELHLPCGNDSFQIEACDVDEPMSEHVDGGLALFQDDVAYERFVPAVGRTM
jgi:hypothetical protein